MSFNLYMCNTSLFLKKNRFLEKLILIAIYFIVKIDFFFYKWILKKKS